MFEQGITQRHPLKFIREHKARRAVQPVQEDGAPPQPPGRLPRVAKLMALAIRFEHLIETGAVRDQTDLAELGHVTRARITQLMNLLHLAPDIQSELLFLPRVTEGRDPIAERHVRPIAAEPSWEKQRALWRRTLAGNRQTDQP
jgi:hypothetical protein